MRRLPAAREAATASDSVARIRSEETCLPSTRSSRWIDHLGLLIPYDYMDIDHSYEPDFVARPANGVTVVLEIKGFEDDQDKCATHGGETMGNCR